MKQIRTVAGVIRNEEGKLLCTLRDQGKYDYVSFKFDFPGGKIEEGETLEKTLTRELHEELELDVEIGKFYHQVEHVYPDFHLSMAVFDCKVISKELKMNVHKGIKWHRPTEMMNLNWAAADIPVAQLVAQGI